jgi:two-component system sensor histidine kinase BaeS
MARIIVAEDDRKQAELLRSYLERDGHSVVLTHDGHAALDELRARRPDLVLLDVMLPGLDGFEICQAIRAERLATAVIMVTARVGEDDQIAGLDYGADDYITKPYSLRQLMAHIRAVLRRTGAGDEQPVTTVGGLQIDHERWVRSLRAGAHGGHAHRQPAPQDRGQPCRTAVRIDGEGPRLQAGRSSRDMKARLMRTWSVRARVIALTVGVAAVAIAVTAWLATRSAEQAVRSRAEQSLETNVGIYQALVDFGSIHQDWKDVGPLLTELADKTGRRVAIADERGRIIADSDVLAGDAARSLPRTATAMVDAANPSIYGYDELVPQAEIGSATIRAAIACLDDNDVPYTLDGSEPDSYPVPGDEITEDEYAQYNDCTDPLSGNPVGYTERLNTDVEACVRDAGFTPVRYEGSIDIDEETDDGYAALDECYTDAVNSRIAPPVMLYIGTRDEAPGPFDGSTLGTTLPLMLGLLVLGTAAAWFLARRLTRPLRRLTTAADALASGDLTHRVDVTGDDEIGVLSNAFNSLASSLERNEQLRRQMVSDIAHELRNPLLVINGTLEAIEDGVYAPSGEVISSLMEETEHLYRLVLDLQDLSVADDGGLRVELRAGDLVEVAASVIEAHRPVAERAAIVLQLIDEGSVPVRIDPSRMRQVVGNLVGNALRHTNSGGHVTVRVRPGGVDVTDDGEGIAAHDLPNVFERFWRSDSSRTRATGGAGLGLAIAMELVKAHGGSMSVTSEVGVGTTFSVTGLQPAAD